MGVSVPNRDRDLAKVLGKADTETPIPAAYRECFCPKILTPSGYNLLFIYDSVYVEVARASGNSQADERDLKQ